MIAGQYLMKAGISNYQIQTIALNKLLYLDYMIFCGYSNRFSKKYGCIESIDGLHFGILRICYGLKGYLQRLDREPSGLGVLSFSFGKIGKLSPSPFYNKCQNDKSKIKKSTKNINAPLCALL
jgi:hypothetical protein